jgi:hypothetical protein
MRQTDSRGAGLETPRPPATDRVHPLPARIARHACRAYRRARRAYLRLKVEWDRLPPGDPAERDRTCDAMTMLESRAEDACLAALLAIMPGDGSAYLARTTDRGNHGVIVDGAIFMAVWDQDGGSPLPGKDAFGQSPYSDGHYRLFVLELDNLVDLTPARWAPAPADAPESPRHAAAFPVLAGGEWKVQYAATAEAMAETFEPSASLYPAESGGGFFGITRLGSDAVPGPTVREFLQDAPARAPRPRRPAGLRGSKLGRAATGARR